MEGKQHYKIKLHEKSNASSWEAYATSLGISFVKKEYFPNYEIYKIEKPSEEILQKISERSEVSRVEVMHRYALNFQTREMDAKKPEISLPEEGEKYPVVGILDNGVAKIEGINPWLYEDRYSYCPEEKHPTHGNFVAGVILYGEEWNAKKWVGGEKVKIYDAALVPDFSIHQLEEDELLERLKQAVEEHSWIKVWNLAISIRFEVDLTHISDFGLLLDYLQEKYDILICKSCGNGNFTKRKEDRGSILQGSDTIRSLVVASCNEAGKLSSFSLSGRGHQILEKPDISMYGGDVSWTETGKRKIEGVYSFSPSGEIVSSFGTSFATAKIVSLVGNILFWKENATALFLKAMVVHTAKEGEKYYLGYGYPKNTKGIQEEYEKSFVVENMLSKEECIVLQYRGGKISCTLVSDIILDYHQKEDYVLCDVDLRFRKAGREFIPNNIFGEYQKLNNVKRYEFTMEEQDGEIEIVFSKRWKQKKYEEKDRKLAYCFLWKK